MVSERGRGPVLVACAHGTASAVGREAVAGVLDDVRALRPGLEVRAAFVDVQDPVVDDVVRHVLADGARAVVVPVLLSPGFHTAVDVAAAVDVPGAVATPPLGPDRLLVQILVDRIREAGAGPDDAIVLAAAGSSDPRAAAAALRTATMLDEALREEALGEAALLERDAPARVSVGYGTAVAPSVPEAVRTARARHGRVVIASYLLAPGVFHDRLVGAGADAVTAPLAPDVRLAQIVLARYDAAAGQSAVAG